MFMTALNSAENRLEGFEIGADEYLPKPFHLKEFILRVRHVLATQRVPEVVHARGRTIDLGALSVVGPDGERAFLQVRDGHVLKILLDGGTSRRGPRGDSRSGLGTRAVPHAPCRGQRDRPTAAGVAGRSRSTDSFGPGCRLPVGAGFGSLRTAGSSSPFHPHARHQHRLQRRLAIHRHIRDSIQPVGAICHACEHRVLAVERPALVRRR